MCEIYEIKGNKKYASTISNLERNKVLNGITVMKEIFFEICYRIICFME